MRVLKARLVWVRVPLGPQAKGSSPPWLRMFMLNTTGKALEEIEAERSGRPTPEQVPA